MPLLPEKSASFRLRRVRERGNVLITILIAIILLALLTQMITQSSEQQSDTLSSQQREDEISRMLSQASTLGGAIHQMIVNGENPATLYMADATGLSQLKSGDAGYNTAPHNLKVYHPLGGGIKYMAATSNGAAPEAFGFNINKGSIITGAGATDVTVGDLVFTATIASAESCQRINAIQLGDTTVPVMATATFDALFTAGTTVTVDATNCVAGCVNIARTCVSNTGATAWGYYDTLYPG